MRGGGQLRREQSVSELPLPPTHSLSEKEEKKEICANFASFLVSQSSYPVKKSVRLSAI